MPNHHLRRTHTSSYDDHDNDHDDDSSKNSINSIQQCLKRADNVFLSRMNDFITSLDSACADRHG